MTTICHLPHGQFLTESAIREGMDLLFFANTRHLKRADQVLANEGMGRAHHRVLYFVARQPGITVSALRGILGVAKQSLARTHRDLIDRGLIMQLPGEVDRRERRSFLTDAGAAFERSIFDELHDNVAKAYLASGADAVLGFWIVMQHLMGEEGRFQFHALRAKST